MPCARRTSKRSKAALPTSPATFRISAGSACRRWCRSTASAPIPPREHKRLQELCAAEGVKAVIADHWAQGGAGAVELAHAVIDLAESETANLRFLYPDEMPLLEKVRTIAQRIYGASDIEAGGAVQDQFAQLQAQGYGHFPVCIAKTQFSFTTDPAVKGAPSGFTVAIREVRLSAGAEFVVAICGDIMTMPGLPRVPAANTIEVDGAGRITGLF